MSATPVAPLPITVWFVAVADEGSASVPIIVLLDPDVITSPAPFPKPILFDPVFDSKALYPDAVLDSPVVFHLKARYPDAVL